MPDSDDPQPFLCTAAERALLERLRQLAGGGQWNQVRLDVRSLAILERRDASVELIGDPAPPKVRRAH